MASMSFQPSFIEKFNFPLPPPQQLIKLPPPEEFPEWYSNDPTKTWKSGTWEDYTDAADQLDVFKSDKGFYSLQKRENSAFTLCHEDLVSSKFRFKKGCNMKGCVIPYSKITETDRVNFELLLDEAEKDLQLFYDYFSPAGERTMLQHDSTVENVVGRLPSRYINNTQGPMFHSLLKRLISMAKKQHEEKLYYEYTLFLPKSDCIKSGTTAADCFVMLKDDPDFVAKKFGDLESYYLLSGMQSYLNYREAGGDISTYNAQIEQDYQWQRDVTWKARSRFPGELMTPIHFLAFKKRCKGYHVQHPVKEIMKFRAYFGLFLEGVPPSWRPKPQSPEPSQVGSSPSLERPKKRILRHRT